MKTKLRFGIVIFIFLCLIIAIILLNFLFSQKDFYSEEEVNENCINAGQSANEYSFGKYIGPKICCEGLIKIKVKEYKDGVCSEVPDSGSICSDCGNSICEEWENRCNCPEDCS